MNYSNFNTQDFVENDSFQAWVKYPTPETEQFWTTFLAENPHKIARIQEAKNIILQLSEAEHRLVSEKSVRQIWQNIEQAIDVAEEESAIEPSRFFIK
jgi:transmembrane sensor